MRAPIFTGACTAIITPFSENGVDVLALERLVAWQIQNGIKALVACGTTGEPSTMDDEEWALALSTIIRAADGRVPVIAGTGGNNTAHVIKLARRARDLGAAAQLCVTPYYNKTTQQGLVAHYTAIARDGSLPIILYNVPSRTGLNMSPEALAEIAELEQVVGMKEASADLIRVADMMRLCENRIAFYSGTDEVVVPLMALGGLGVISVLSNAAPAETVKMTEAMLAGNYKEAAEWQLRLMPLIHLLFVEVNPIPAKAAAKLLGFCEDRVRLPLVPMTEKNRAFLKAEMEKLGLLR